MLSLLVLTVLIVLITQFAFTARVEKTIARNSKDDLKMLFAARGTLAFVKAHLRAKREKGEPADSLRDEWADPSLEAVKIGDVVLRMKLEDSERLLNVNLLAEPAARPFMEGVLTRLAEQLQVENPAELVARIKDFIDEDKEGEFEVGARNGPLYHANELLGMQPMTPEVEAALIGRQADPADPEVPAQRGMLEFLTTSGKKTININTVSLELMRAILPNEINGTAVDKDAAIAELDKFRTGAEEGQTGTTAGTAPTDPAQPRGVEAAAPAGEEGEKPGKNFNNVQELAQVQGFQNIFAAPQQQPAGGAPAGTAGAAPAPRALRSFLSIDGQDFRIDVTAERAGLRKRYEMVLRRGQDQFDVLLFREVGR